MVTSPVANGGLDGTGGHFGGVFGLGFVLAASPAFAFAIFRKYGVFATVGAYLDCGGADEGIFGFGLLSSPDKVGTGVSS